MGTSNNPNSPEQLAAQSIFFNFISNFSSVLTKKLSKTHSIVPLFHSYCQ